MVLMGGGGPDRLHSLSYSSRQYLSTSSCLGLVNEVALADGQHVFVFLILVRDCCKCRCDKRGWCAAAARPPPVFYVVRPCTQHPRQQPHSAGGQWQRCCAAKCDDAGNGLLAPMGTMRVSKAFLHPWAPGVSPSQVAGCNKP